MILVRFVIFFYALIFGSAKLYAQKDFAKLERNVNVRAQGLAHYLNSSKDTLILKSDSIINKLYTINMNYQRELDLSINQNTVEVPLNKLSKGKHVVVAVQSPIRIVFVVQILQDYEFLVALREEKLAAKNKK